MQELVESRIRVLLADEPVAHVGVIAWGKPYVTPVSYVWLDDSLWFRTGPGMRLDAITANPEISAEISRFDFDTGYWESVVLAGTGEVIDDPDAGDEVERALRKKYRRITRSALDMPPDVVPREGSVVRVTVESISGRSSGAGLDGPARPGRL
jgi:nitroimidazol reductase NimA-like FMN-containing flavoprotein (pyridoxamine 5'-phosphate oxidase superfamily)